MELVLIVSGFAAADCEEIVEPEYVEAADIEQKRVDWVKLDADFALKTDVDSSVEVVDAVARFGKVAVGI